MCQGVSFPGGSSEAGGGPRAGETSGAPGEGRPAHLSVQGLLEFSVNPGRPVSRLSCTASSACVFDPNQRVSFCSRSVKECKTFAVDSLIASPTSFQFYSSPQGIQRNFLSCETKTSSYCHFPMLLAGDVRRILQETRRRLQPVSYHRHSVLLTRLSTLPFTHRS